MYAIKDYLIIYLHSLLHSFLCNWFTFY